MLRMLFAVFVLDDVIQIVEILTMTISDWETGSGVAVVSLNHKFTIFCIFSCTLYTYIHTCYS